MQQILEALVGYMYMCLVFMLIDGYKGYVRVNIRIANKINVHLCPSIHASDL